MTGVVPLVRLGPFSVGPSPIEFSRISAPEVAVYVEPIQSLINRQLVLKVCSSSKLVCTTY